MATHPDPNKPPDGPHDKHDPHKDPHQPSDAGQGGAGAPHPGEVKQSDSFIDLGLPGGPTDPFASGPQAEPHEASDISNVEWASFIDEAAPADAEPSSPKIDRPSDQDWAKNAEVAPPEPPVKGRPPTQPAVDVEDLFAEPVDLQSESPSQTGARSAPPLPHEAAPDMPALADESSAERESLAADIEVVRQTFNLDDMDSQKKLAGGGSGPTTPAPAKADEDVFELNQPAAEGSGPFSSSGVDLKQLDSGSFEDIVAEVVEEAAPPTRAGGGSSVDLGSAELPRMSPEQPQEGEQPPSGRDLIAEAVESGVDLKQPLMEIVEEEEAMEASEVVESSDKMKQPLMEIAEGEEAMEASEVVESSGKMKRPLMEIAEEMAKQEEAAEAAEVVEEEESSAVDLGAPAQKQALTPEEMGMLEASQEMGAAAEPEKPGARKTVVAGQGPVRATQLSDQPPEEAAEAAEEVADEVFEDEATITAPGDAAVEEVAEVEPEIPSEEDIVLNEPRTGSKVNLEQGAAGPGSASSGLDLDALLREKDKQEGMASSDSGLLLGKPPAKQPPAHAVDPEEVQLGEPAAEEEEAAAETPVEEMEEVGEAAHEEEKPAKPPKQKSRALALVGGGLLGLLVGVGGAAGVYFSGLLPEKKSTAPPASNTAQTAELTKLRGDKEAADRKAADLEAAVAAEKKNADDATANLQTANAEKKKAEDALAAEKMKGADDAKTAMATIDGLKKSLGDEKQKADGALAELKKATDDKKKADDAVVTANKMLADQKKAADMERADAATKAKALEDKLKTADAEAATLKADLAKANDIAKTVDPQGMIRKLQGEVTAATAALKERHTPEDMLSVWLPALEDRSRKDLAAQALQDADRVLNDPKAKPELKARATALKGLLLRNEEKFAEARAKLEEAKKNLAADAAWAGPVDAALKEVSNPAATYIARVDVQRTKGDYKSALDELDKAIKALPEDKRGDLLAERSLLRLEARRVKAGEPLTATDKEVAAASEDAKLAAAAKSAHGFYAEGRIAEALGKWPEAVAAYRKAYEAHGELDAQGTLYRAALARALLRSQGKTVPADEKTGRLPKPGADESLETLAVLLTLALQPAPLPPAYKTEAMKLADEILSLPPDKVPFDIRAQAFAVKGLHTEALKTYADGLKTRLPADYADGLMQMIENHPALKRPDSLTEPNPFNAEKHYGAGLRWFWDRNYANAEKEFLEAVKNDRLDARYFYFLGLSRLAQDKPEAREDFVQAAKLEEDGHPSRAAVNAALERIQGPMRIELNAVRNQPK
jgi:hypothetical protein